MLSVLKGLLIITNIITYAMTINSFWRGDRTIGTLVGVASIILTVLIKTMKNLDQYMNNIKNLSINELHSKQMNYFIIISVSYIILSVICYLLLDSEVTFAALGVWVLPISYSYLSLYTKRYDSKYLFLYGNIMFFLCNLPLLILFIGGLISSSEFKDRLFLVLGFLLLDAPIFWISHNNNEKLHGYQ